MQNRFYLSDTPDNTSDDPDVINDLLIAQKATLASELIIQGEKRTLVKPANNLSLCT